MHPITEYSEQQTYTESKQPPDTLSFSDETWEQDLKEGGGFFQFEKKALALGIHLRLPELKRYLAICRYNPWWLTPRLGTSFDVLDRESVCLLWEDIHGSSHVLLPLLDRDLIASLIGEEEGLGLRINGPLDSHPHDTAVLLYAATGDDPLQLVADAVAQVARRLGTFRIREEKTQPAYASLLGWCTWTAFYQDVSEEGVLAGLEGFRSSGMVPPLLILDDGWQDTHDQTLLSFRAHPGKFPNGLKSLVERAKDEFGVKMFGVWHALQGYWGGVHPDGEVGEAYPLINHTAALFQDWDKWAERKRFIVAPSAAHRMFGDWYAQLSAQGVDMVKVDSQSSHGVFLDDANPLVAAMRNYHAAIVAEASNHFAGNLLNCMSNSLEIAYQSGASIMWRNSEDYAPNKPAFHQECVFMNAMNNVWSSTFSWPDWDMFQSDDEDAEFLAASLAISGSPIYVGDVPGTSNVSLIKKLCVSDGRTLRCPQPSLPAKDVLFMDCHRDPVALKIVNRNATIGFIGLFHCYAENGLPSEEALTGSFTPADVPNLKGENFAVWRFREQRLSVLGKTMKDPFRLDKMGYELITLAPIWDDFAAIGLLDKFNPAAAIEECRPLKHGWSIRLCDGGRVGFYSLVAPRKITSASGEIPFHHHPKTGLLECLVTEGQPIELDVYFA